LEGTLKIIWFQPPCREQGHLPPDHVSPARQQSQLDWGTSKVPVRGFLGALARAWWDTRVPVGTGLSFARLLLTLGKRDSGYVRCLEESGQRRAASRAAPAAPEAKLCCWKRLVGLHRSCLY